MNQEQAEDILKSIGCWRSGHFVLRHPTDNPRHSGDCMDNDPLMLPENAKALDQLALAIATQARGLIPDISRVTGPAKGGLALATQVAKHLSGRRTVPVVNNTKTRGELREGFDFGSKAHQLRGQRVLVVEDTLTTGRSVGQIVDLVNEAGGSVVAVGAILNRGNVTADQLQTRRLFSLVNRELPSFDTGLNPGDFSHSGCPLCRAGVQIDIDIGNGKKFVDMYGQPPKSL